MGRPTTPLLSVDIIIEVEGRPGIVLIARKNPPHGWALPGGFVDTGERLVDACLRELREETRLKLPEPVLRGSIKATRVFD